MKSEKSIERKFLKVISSAKFFEWYCDGGTFDRYLMADTACKTQKEILKDIKKFLK